MNFIKILVAFIFVPVIISKIIDISHRCPERLSKNCHCNYYSTGERIIVQCENKLAPKIDYDIQSLDKIEINILYLKNSAIANFDWETVGKYINAQVIIMKNMKIWNLRLFDALRNVQDTLYRLELINVSTAGLNLTYPENAFKQLRYFHLSHCSEKHLWGQLNANSIVPRLPKYLREIDIQRCKVERFEDNFFARFTNLHKLDLSNNRLRSVKRNYLPRPANVFSSYDLSFNPIAFLPKDMFADMPALEAISLQRTLLTALHYHIFEPVINQLKSLAINNIPLSCNCKAAWLLNKKNIWKRHGFSCRLPASLRGRKGSSLVPSELLATCNQAPPGYYTADLTTIPSYYRTVEASTHKNDYYYTGEKIAGTGNYTMKNVLEKIVKPRFITIAETLTKIANQLRVIINRLGKLTTD